MKIIRAWNSGDGFRNYPDLEEACDMFASEIMRCSQSVMAAEFKGNKEPWQIGDIVMTDWRGWHKVIVITRAELEDGEYVYEGIPLSTANGDTKYEGSVLLKDYNSILEFGPRTSYGYGVYIQVKNTWKFTKANYHPTGAFKGHVKPQFLRALMSWLHLSDEDLMNLKTVW